MHTENITNQTIHTRVVGVSFEKRQSVVACLQLGEKVLLIREPENRFDPNAVKVIRQDGRQFGYLDRYLAAELVVTLDRFGESVLAEVALLTGGHYIGSSLGVVIKFDLPE